MTVYLVGAGPGDPGLLTRRGAKLVSEADVVIFDRLVHRSLLALAPSSAELVDVGKRPDGAQTGTGRQAEINRLLVVHGRQSHTVVRLKGGDPFVFGRGGEEGDVLTRAGVPWQIVPRALPEMLLSGDASQTQRMMRAIFGMKKLDIAKLRQAFGPSQEEVS